MPATPSGEEYLVKSFAGNKPWDQLAREVLAADTKDPNLNAADKFYLDRGGDLHLITKDVGRLFLGRNIRYASAYAMIIRPSRSSSKRDYYGLYVFLNRSFLFKEGKLSKFAEKPARGQIDFESVFTMQKMMTGALLPGEKAVVEPAFPKGGGVPPTSRIPREARRARRSSARGP